MNLKYRNLIILQINRGLLTSSIRLPYYRPQIVKPALINYKTISDPKVGEENYFENEALKLTPASGYVDKLSELFYEKKLCSKDLRFRARKFFLIFCKI